MYVKKYAKFKPSLRSNVVGVWELINTNLLFLAKIKKLMRDNSVYI